MLTIVENKFINAYLDPMIKWNYHETNAGNIKVITSPREHSHI